MITVSNK